MQDFSQTMKLNLKDFTLGQYDLTFLGAGSAFTVGDNNYQSNVLITNRQTGRRLLVDCGSDARFAIHELGLKPTDINDVFISHLHADHIGGLEWLAFSTKFNPAAKKPRLLISRQFITELWASSLAGGLESLEGETATLETYFDIEKDPTDGQLGISKKGRFKWEGLEMQMVQVVHIVNDFSISPSYGLMFQANGVKVFFTSDTQFGPNQLAKFYDMADIIFHDCETAPFRSKVHAHYDDLKTLPENIKKKMWLYHYQPGKTQDALADGFRGFVVKGQKFELDEKLK